MNVPEHTEQPGLGCSCRYQSLTSMWHFALDWISHCRKLLDHSVRGQTQDLIGYTMTCDLVGSGADLHTVWTNPEPGNCCTGAVNPVTSDWLWTNHVVRCGSL